MKNLHAGLISIIVHALLLIHMHAGELETCICIYFRCDGVVEQDLGSKGVQLQDERERERVQEQWHHLPEYHGK